MALGLLPLVVSAVTLLVKVGSKLYPPGDIAGTELHVRDVGHHPVLLGLFSRDGWNHPGPILFYLLAVPYRLTGSRSIGLLLGALLINGAAILGMTVIARRRGGTPLMLLTLLGCGLVVRSLNPEFLRSPWNVWITVLPFGLLVLLTWEMIGGSAWALPASAFVASFCIQTHVGYALLAVPLLLLGTSCLVAQSYRRRQAGGRRGVRRDRLLLAALGAIGVLALLWLPPVLQQLTGDHGNLGKIVAYFLDDPGKKAQHTFAEGWRVMSDQFGVHPEWINGHRALTPLSSEPLSLHRAALPFLLLPFLGVGFALWRRRDKNAFWLTATVGLTLGLGVVWIARTLGPVYDYRLGWIWVVTMLAFVATVWGAWRLLEERVGPIIKRALGAACVVALCAITFVNARDAAKTPNDGYSPQIATLARQTDSALPRGSGEVIVRCSGDEGCIYSVSLLLWLERRGIDARVDIAFGLAGSDSAHRVHRHGHVRAVLDVEISKPFAKFDAAADRPGHRMIAYWGLLPRAERDRLVQTMSTIGAQREAGTLDRVSFFLESLDLTKRLNSPAVGVFLKPRR
jgi:hypothetical protein